MERRSSKRKSSVQENAPAVKNAKEGNKMISLLPSQVPEFLRDSEFYRALNLEEDEMFLIPENAMCESADLHSAHDVKALLEAVRFWGIRSIPKSLIHYAMTHSSGEFATACAQYTEDVPYLHEVSQFRSKSLSLCMHYAMRSEYVKIVEYMHTVRKLPLHSAGTAAEYGRTNNLRYAYEHGHRIYEDTCVAAAKSGNMGTLLYALQNSLNFSAGAYSRWIDYTLVCYHAALRGDVRCLTLAHEKGWPWSSKTTQAAAEGNSVSALTYLHENGCPWDSNTCKAAATHGSLECLEYAHRNGCAWNSTTCDAAALNGHLLCLSYAHERGCAVTNITAACAAKGGKLDCLQYLHEHGCAWCPRTISNALVNDHVECVKYAVEHACPCEASDQIQVALATGNTTQVQVASHLIDRTDSKACVQAAKYGNLECLRYLHDELGCPLGTSITQEALRCKHFDCLRYALQHDCSVDECSARHELARCGQLELLTLLHGLEQGDRYRGGCVRR